MILLADLLMQFGTSRALVKQSNAFILAIFFSQVPLSTQFWNFWSPCFQSQLSFISVSLFSWLAAFDVGLYIRAKWRPGTQLGGPDLSGFVLRLKTISLW